MAQSKAVCLIALHCCTLNSRAQEHIMSIMQNHVAVSFVLVVVFAGFRLHIVDMWSIETVHM